MRYVYRSFFCLAVCMLGRQARLFAEAGAPIDQWYQSKISALSFNKLLYLKWKMSPF